MNLVEDRIFHIYNQGNNRQPIFFEKENYFFFLRKMQTHILPYADFLAWCLMPNHFHWMIYVRKTELLGSANRIQTSPGNFVIKNAGIISEPSKPRISEVTTLNQSIGVLLASYTRAINKRNGFSGSLFRKKTQAICLNDNSVTLKAGFSHLE
ncbi:MAG: hypothetical protein JNL22_08035 [Bacteroidales bacterium]|nr:hypothetical protein [Bacteroidales bacterium]